MYIYIFVSDIKYYLLKTENNRFSYMTLDKKEFKL